MPIHLHVQMLKKYFYLEEFNCCSLLIYFLANSTFTHDPLKAT